MKKDNALDFAKALYKVSIEAVNNKHKVRTQYWKQVLPIFKVNMLQWFFTNKCNFSCDYCSVPSTDKEMSSDERSEGLEFLVKNFRPRMISITGGEPTLKFDELIGFISQASRLGVYTALNTNGSLVTESRLRGLSDAGLDFISFSYDKVSPKDDPDVLEKARRSYDYGMVGTVQTVFSTANWHLRQRIAEEVIGKGVFFNPVIVNSIGQAYSSQQLQQPPKEEVRKFYGEDLAKFWYKIKISEHFMKVLREFGDAPKCHDFKWLTVNYDGRLRHCNEYLTDFKISDLSTKQGVKAFEEYRKKVSETCHGCFYECYHTSQSRIFLNHHFNDRIKLEFAMKQAYAFKIMRLMNEELG